MFKKISLILLATLFILAGVNHFRSPEIYLEIMPPYFPIKATLNIVVGVLEIILGILLFFKKCRYVAAMGIIVLLILFVPVHIFMIQKGGCTGEYFCFPAWVAWVRLFPLQFILIWWAWRSRR